MAKAGRHSRESMDQCQDRRLVTGTARLFFVSLLSAVLCAVIVLPLPVSATTWDPETVLSAYLKEHYPWAEIEVTELRLDREQPVERPSAITVEKTPPGRSAFRFDFPRTRSVTATALIKAYDRVLMSRSGFRKGYVLRQGDMYATLMETGRIPKGAVRDEHGVIGKQLLRAIVSNMPITDAMVSDKPLVKKGHKVVLAVESETFSIRTQGEMHHDAAVGEYVKVSNTLSKKIVTGFLVDENTVRVEF